MKTMIEEFKDGENSNSQLLEKLARRDKEIKQLKNEHKDAETAKEQIQSEVIKLKAKVKE